MSSLRRTRCRHWGRCFKGTDACIYPHPTEICEKTLSACKASRKDSTVQCRCVHQDSEEQEKLRSQNELDCEIRQQQADEVDSQQMRNKAADQIDTFVKEYNKRHPDDECILPTLCEAVEMMLKEWPTADISTTSTDSASIISAIKQRRDDLYTTLDHEKAVNTLNVLSKGIITLLEQWPPKLHKIQPPCFVPSTISPTLSIEPVLLIQHSTIIDCSLIRKEKKRVLRLKKAIVHSPWQPHSQTSGQMKSRRKSNRKYGLTKPSPKMIDTL